jgi:hypothetical protein
MFAKKIKISSRYFYESKNAAGVAAERSGARDRGAKRSKEREREAE